MMGSATSRGIKKPGPVHPLARLLSRLWLVPKRTLLRRRIRRTVVERILGRAFVVVPEVMNPAVFRSGAYFAEVIAETALAEPAASTATALDVGTGCGLLATVAADRGFAATGVDISPHAVRCARANVLLNDLEDRVRILEGDLFAPVAGEQFDLVLASLPKFRGRPGSAFEISWRSPDVIERFAEGLPAALKPAGVALVLLTTHGDPDGMLTALEGAGLRIDPVCRRHMGNEIMTVYAVRREADDG